MAATHFALEHAFRLDDLAAAARTVPVADTFDRVALERAVAGIAAAHRKLTAEVVADLGAGPEAVEAWAKARGAALARIREAVDAIGASGLTVSKATVAASLLGDLVRAIERATIGWPASRAGSPDSARRQAADRMAFAVRGLPQLSARAEVTASAAGAAHAHREAEADQRHAAAISGSWP